MQEVGRDCSGSWDMHRDRIPLRVGAEHSGVMEVLCASENAENTKEMFASFYSD